jgi:predicted RNA binding protein YcfA (HicA-like mRNA interferase family)
VSDYPAMRWPELRRILTRAPLSYSLTRQNGSHKTLKADGRPTLHLAFHDNAELPGGLIEKILTKDVGLSDDEVRGLL